jgi:hypothetical protein
VVEEKVRGRVRVDEWVRCCAQVDLRGAVNCCLRSCENDWTAVAQSNGQQTLAVHVTSALRKMKPTSKLGVK